MSKFLSALFAVALFGGANITPRQTQAEVYQGVSLENGYVVVATHHDIGLEALRFAKIDPRTCETQSTLTIDYDPTQSGEALQHGAFEPGIWVVAETTFKDGRERKVVRYENGTFAFEVISGEATYVGKLNLSENGSAIDRPDREALAQYVNDNADIPAGANVVIPWITPYSAENTGPVANCNAGPLAFLDEAA